MYAPLRGSCCADFGICSHRSSEILQETVGPCLGLCPVKVHLGLGLLSAQKWLYSPILWIFSMMLNFLREFLTVFMINISGF